MYVDNNELDGAGVCFYPWERSLERISCVLYVKGREVAYHVRCGGGARRGGWVNVKSVRMRCKLWAEQRGLRRLVDVYTARSGVFC